MKNEDLPLDASAKAVLSRAREESARLRHEYVGTEHIALALLRLTPLSATRILQDFGIDAEEVRKEIESMVGPGDAGGGAEVSRPYTTHAQHAFALAGRCAEELGGSAIGAEHLLVGLLREQGVGGQVLGHRGLSADAVEAAIRG